MSKPPVDPEKMRDYEFLARKLFDMLDHFAGGALERREVGMALFIFNFNGAELTYISNANRQDMVKLILEFASKQSEIPEKTWDEQHG